MKIQRNDSCICGSGKKYKRCCLLKRETNTSQFDTYNTLKMLSYLQLVPENHGKNLRIEQAIGEILVKSKNDLAYQSTENFNIKRTLSKLNQDYPVSTREDPPENSFVENITFKNGNNLVFPGITEESTIILQNLIDTIGTFLDDFPEKFVSEVLGGLTFMFVIHNDICDQLGFSRYLFKDQVKDELHLEDEFQIININLTEFSEFEIKSICNRLNLNEDIIDEFLTDISSYKFSNSNINNNPLIYKPFIKIDDTYLLLTPSTQIIAMGQFIFNKSKEHGCYDLLLQKCDLLVYSEYLNIFESVGFRMTNIACEPKNIFSPPFINTLQFDNNKFAVLKFLSEIENKEMTNLKFGEKEIKEIEDVRDAILSKEPDVEIHLIVVTNKLSMISMRKVTLPSDLMKIRFTTILSLFQLNALKAIWDIDQLSLWKFEKARERSKDKIELIPYFSLLTYFDWYKNNNGSFLHPERKIDLISFDFYNQAQIVRKSNSILDRHSQILISNDKSVGHVTVKKKEKYISIYEPIRKSKNEVLAISVVFDTPIWTSYQRNYGYLGEGLSNSIFYWLEQFRLKISEKMKLFGSLPIKIELNFDSRFINKNSNDIDQLNISASINVELRKVIINIPYNFYNKITDDKKSNQDEKEIISSVLNGIGKLYFEETSKKFFSIEEVIQMIDSEMSDQDRRVIIPADNDMQITLNNTGVVQFRYFQETDVSYIRENILEWLSINNLDFITTREHKVKFFNKVVTKLIEKYREFVKQYNSLELLRFVLIRYESNLFYHHYSESTIAHRLRCATEKNILLSEYELEKKKSIPSMLAYRCLIEFIVAEPFSGKKSPNIDDVDYLHALIEQIISFGNLSDLINEGFSDTEVDLLPSGRIGIDHSFFENELKDLSKSMINDEITSKTNRINETIDTYNLPADYVDQVNNAFQKDWGIGLFDIYNICRYLAEYSLYEKESSFVTIKKSDFYSLFKKSTFTTKEIDSFLDVMVLSSRNGLLNVPEGCGRQDTYPWRYNRKLSFLRLPIINLFEENEEKLIWGPRHLILAGENVLALFNRNTLKVSGENRNIHKFLAKRNAINGANFRSKVVFWLKQLNSNWQIIDHEVKIEPKGHLHCEKDLGDLDILALDHDDKVIYLVEVKNTKQAKIIYEFKKDIDTYLKNLIPKHMRRAEWVKGNKSLISDFLQADVSSYTTFSVIVSSSILPVKYLDKSPIPIFSLGEFVDNNGRFV